MTELETLKRIKISSNRKIEISLDGCDDTLQTIIADNSFANKNELVDLLLDTAIKYLEEKGKNE